MTIHDKYMQRCLQLALAGAGKVAPNPMVGSVLVYENKIIGEGYHEQYGAAHAEVNCINSVAEAEKHLIEKATLYVSLEPCNHQGKTPPCTEFILKNKIRQVVCGCSDQSAKVNGGGNQWLKDHGVHVIENVLENDCIEINKRFFHFEKSGQAYVILKWAQSADGFIAKKNERTKISNAFTDRIVHRWRTEEAAIMAGYHTALTDDPQLNARLVQGENPVRIVLDEQLTLPPHLLLFDQSQQTIVFNFVENKTRQNIEYIMVSRETYIQDIVHALYKKNILSLIVEGGGRLLQAFIDCNIWNEARVISSNQFLYEGIQGPHLKNAVKTCEIKVSNDTIYFHKNLPA